MRGYLKYGCLILTFLMTFTYCKKKSSELVPVDYSYFPLKLKSWVIYNITFRKVDKDVNIDTTVHYQLKEIIDTIIEDNTGKPVYRIERYTRPGNGHSWEISQVWQQGIDHNAAYKVEDNIKYVKLRFPVELNKSWNGNIYNSEEPLDYTISSIDQQETINGISFGNVLTVTQQYSQNLIEKFHFFEKYAKNIGLVQKQQISIYSDTPSSPEPIENRILRGELYYMDVVSYGRN